MTQLHQSHFGSGFDSGRSTLIERLTSLEAEAQALREVISELHLDANQHRAIIEMARALTDHDCDECRLSWCSEREAIAESIRTAINRLDVCQALEAEAQALREVADAARSFVHHHLIGQPVLGCPMTYGALDTWHAERDKRLAALLEALMAVYPTLDPTG